MPVSSRGAGDGWFAARLLVAVGSLAALFTWVVSPAQLAVSLHGLDGTWLAAAVALMPLGLLLQWAKWRLLARAGLATATEARIRRSLLAGFGLGLLTPGRLGELGRGQFFPGERRAATVLTATDRLLSAAVTLAIAALCWCAMAPTQQRLVGVLAPALLLAAGGYLLRRRLPRWSGVESLLRVPPKTWVWLLLGSLLFNLVFFAQFLLLLRAAGPLDIAVALAVPLVFAIKTLLPISFLDLGIREGAAVAVLVPAGVPAPVALQAALVLFALNVLLPGLAGLAALTRGAAPTQGVELAHVR